MMCSFFLPKMTKREKKSALINVSSMMGYFDGCAGSAVYVASKAYVNSFTLALAEELKGKIDV